jgi:AFG3 family protein
VPISWTRLFFDKPDIKGRRDIFLVHMKAIKLAGEPDSYAQRLAALTPGFVGADIHNICNEAAIVAARKNKESVDMKDFEAAIDRVIGGLERRNALMSPEEKKTIAYHEAGHAIAGWFLEHADPLLKVTIIPRGSGALGFAQYLPKEVALYTREALYDRMCMALGGRAAEDIMFQGRITTGASDDLDKVTQMAYAMTTIYGMNSRIGTLSFPKREETQFEKPYSDATATVIDEEVKKVVDSAYQRTKELLSTHREKLRGVAELLLSKETINQNDLASIAGPRPWPINPKLKEYIDVMFEETKSNFNDSDSSKEGEGEKKKDGGDSGSDGDAKAEGDSKKGAADEKKEKAEEGNGSKDKMAAAFSFNSRSSTLSSSSPSATAAATLRAIADTLETTSDAASTAKTLGDRAAALVRSWRNGDSASRKEEEEQLSKLRPAYLVNHQQQSRGGRNSSSRADDDDDDDEELR